MDSKERTLWSFSDLCFVLDNQDHFSKFKLAQKVGRTKQAISVLLMLYHRFYQDKNAKGLSANIRQLFERYEARVPVPKPEALLEGNWGAVSQKMNELEDLFENMKRLASEIIELTVKGKMAEERQQTALKLKELQEYKEKAQKGSLFTNLTEKLSNIV